VDAEVPSIYLSCFRGVTPNYCSCLFLSPFLPSPFVRLACSLQLTSMADQETSACPECGVTFTLRQATGSCQRCIKLAVHERGSAGYKDIDVRRNTHVL